MVKKYFTALVPTSITIIALFIFIFHKDLAWNRVLQCFYGLKIWPFMAGILLLLYQFWLRAKRWYYLMAPVKKLSGYKLFPAVMIGFMANNLLPARLGELVRAYVLGESEKVPKSSVLATLVVERIFDGLTIMGLFVVAVFILPYSLSLGHIGTYDIAGLQQYCLLLFGFYILIITLIVLLRVKPEVFIVLLQGVCRSVSLRLSDYATSVMQSFITGLKFNRGSGLVMLIIYSAGIWFVQAASLTAFFLAMNIANLGIAHAVFVMMAATLITIIPAAPGYIGTYQLAVSSAMVFLGVDTNQASGYALLSWAVPYITVNVLGLYYLWREGFGLATLGIRSKAAAG